MERIDGLDQQYARYNGQPLQVRYTIAMGTVWTDSEAARQAAREELAGIIEEVELHDGIAKRAKAKIKSLR